MATGNGNGARHSDPLRDPGLLSAVKELSGMRPKMLSLESERRSLMATAELAERVLAAGAVEGSEFVPTDEELTAIQNLPDLLEKLDRVQAEIDRIGPKYHELLNTMRTAQRALHEQIVKKGSKTDDTELGSLNIPLNVRSELMHAFKSNGIKTLGDLRKIPAAKLEEIPTFSKHWPFIESLRNDRPTEHAA